MLRIWFGMKSKCRSRNVLARYGGARNDTFRPKCIGAGEPYSLSNSLYKIYIYDCTAAIANSVSTKNAHCATGVMNKMNGNIIRAAANSNTKGKNSNLRITAQRRCRTRPRPMAPMRARATRTQGFERCHVGQRGNIECKQRRAHKV